MGLRKVPNDRQNPLPPESIQKTLTRLLSLSGNRSCADCRSLLVDVSQIYASVSPAPDAPINSARVSLTRYKNFRYNHRSFAPPGEIASSLSNNAHPYHHRRAIPDLYDPPVDPALVAHNRVGGGGHGVFVCAPCGAAHKLLGPSVATVHPVQDLASWTRSEAQVLANAGGNARSWSVFEAFLPPSWELKRPKAESDIADRLTFIRAKYEALAFVLPPPGPLAFQAWRRIVNLHPEWSGLWGADLHSVSCSSIFQSHPSSSTQGQLRRSTMQTISTAGASLSRRSELPDRLVDYFCVVAASDLVDLSLGVKDLSALSSPEDVVLVPLVTDCFPLPETHGRDQEFPEHVSTFLFPDGCRPSCMSLPPSFFTFVLTASNGDRLYGGVLRLYDESRDVDSLKVAFDKSGYKGSLPEWLRSGKDGSSRASHTTQQEASDIVFLPKCLVVISHYPFFDLWRKFLLQIYRIALVGAPLPIERFIANFTCEIPLPPPGKIRVKFGFTVKDDWCVERPPENQLPLADFSFRPLFTALSIPNVLIVFACLLQECRVALVCKHYGILGPVAEALTSLLFPLHWEGMYIPVLPYHMQDILDAPVPYLVGLHSRYLQSTPPGNRPKGVVFVDLDRDEVHLGYDDDTNSPRQIPCLPERQAIKLKAKLEEFAACAYVVPPSGNVATVTNGDGDQPLVKRASQLNLLAPESRSSVGGARRRDVFSSADKAYRDNELQVPITGFLSEHGQFFEQIPSTPTGTVSKSKFPRFRALGHHNRSSSFDSSESSEHANMTLLDRHDPPGFSSAEVRGAFLRFFVSLLLDYRQHLGQESFRADDFVAGLPLTAASTTFVHQFLKTQMFDRFIVERRENPFDPEVKFFDESIAAKIKRSKRTVFVNMGRQTKTGTAFLEDNSKLVTETFTPPPPSNWGLPDDGRVYSYGTFPSLNPDLFGKVRPPRTWRGRRSSLRLSRRSSVRTAASEQVVFEKAMVPAMRSTSTLLAVTKRGAKSLEQAIAALSNQFTSPVHNSSAHSHGSPDDRLSVISEVTVPSELGMTEDIVTSAEEVVLNHRRKQAILLGIFMTLQNACRTRYSKQQSLREASMTELQMTSSDSESLQATKEYFATATIQACARGAQARLYYRRARSGAALIQALRRGRNARFAYRLVRITVIQVQCVSRGHLARSRLRTMISGRLLQYRQHLVQLWKSTNTSLCYRSVFWSCIRKENVVQLAFTEDEIRRLWGELGMHPPTFAIELDEPMLADDVRLRVYINCKLNPGRTQESAMMAAAKLGITNRHYVQTMLLHKQDRSVGNPVAAFRTSVRPSNINGSIKQAGSLREVAERIQVYDKLCTSSLFAHEDRLYEFFQRFNVPIKEKRKKVMLSEIVWSDHTLADESAKLMMELFPELKDLSDMHFREPCKKTKGRFKLSGFRPNPLEPRMRAHVVFRDRIQQDVRVVADASLRSVPDLLLRLAPLTQKQRADRRDCNRQLYLRMNSFKTQDPSELRVSMMRDFLHPTKSTLPGSSGGRNGGPPASYATLIQHKKRNVGIRQVMKDDRSHLKGPPVFDLSTISESSPPAFATTIRSESTVFTGQTSLLVQS